MRRHGSPEARAERKNVRIEEMALGRATDFAKSMILGSRFLFSCHSGRDP